MSWFAGRTLCVDSYLADCSPWSVPVRQLGPQNLGQRGEVAALADALDEVLDRAATGYEGQRRFASNASHELRTPLAVQRTLVEVAMVTGEQDLSRLAAQLLVVNERNERLIEGLLVLAESDRGLPGTEPGGTVEVVVAGEPALSVRNTGQRVPAETVAAAHQGSVAAKPRDDGGLTVAVTLP